VNASPLVQQRIADLARAVAGTLIHATIWGVAFYYVSNQWERPFMAWAQGPGSSVTDAVRSLLRIWNLAISFPYATLAIFLLALTADLAIMFKVSGGPYGRLLRELWFGGILALPLILFPILGIRQIRSFLSKQVEPFAVDLSLPEVAKEFSVLNGVWSFHRSEIPKGALATLPIPAERLTIKNGKFQWVSNVIGEASGTVVIDPECEPKRIEFVAVDPNSAWTVRVGIYTLENGNWVVRLPKWDALNLAAPLDFDWEDDRYETLRFVKETAP
jgi:hypothetical protein